jgi:hypothetical protein
MPDSNASQKSAAASVLKLSLLAGASYFVGMTAAHFFSFKYPILFVYWDTHFTAHQDKIISFCAFLYAQLFYEASRDVKHLSGLAMRSMFSTAGGLALVNMSQALQDVMPPGGTTVWYWAQTAMIGSIGVWLAYWRRAAGVV